MYWNFVAIDGVIKNQLDKYMTWFYCITLIGDWILQASGLVWDVAAKGGAVLAKEQQKWPSAQRLAVSLL
jgi:hypothetical protein